MYVTSPIKTVESDIILQADAFDTNENLSAREVVFKEGENLFFAGDDADYIYQVIDGVVRSSKVLMDGRRQVLSFGYPGDMIGLSHDSYYHCDCDAVSEVRVRLYRKNAYMKEIVQDPEFCALLLNNAAAEVNSMQDHFLMLGRKTAMEKLASFLIAIMDRQMMDERIVFDLPMKRSDIADFLGMTIETVSRNLTRLRKLGVIELQNTHQVCVRKPGLLREMAETEA